MLLLSPLHQAIAHEEGGTTNHHVNIPDPNLRARIESRLSKTSGQAITANELAGLTGQLWAPNRGIRDLTGLEHATGLTTLYLWETNINDISALSGLTSLTHLELNYTKQLSNLKPLSSLRNLTKLDLRFRRSVTRSPTVPRDLSPLRNLTSLEVLNLLYNNIQGSNISALADLTKLKQLNLEGTNITERGLASVLPTLTKLEWLYITRTPVTARVLFNLAVPGGLKRLWMEALGTPLSSGSPAYGRLLTDLLPLVTLVRTGKIENVGANYLSIRNFGLDYDSLYTHLPDLVDEPIRVSFYKDVDLELLPVSPIDNIGRPGTTYTFVVRATSITIGRYRNYRLRKAPITFIAHTPEGNSEAQILTRDQVLTNTHGLAAVTVRLGNHGDIHTIDAVMAAPTRTVTGTPTPSQRHVTFTIRVDTNAPPPEPITLTVEDDTVETEGDPLETVPLPDLSPYRITNRCGLGWSPQAQFQARRPLPKVMIYALEFEYMAGSYTCKAIEIRTGDASIETLAGWKLYLGRRYNPSYSPLSISEEHAEVTDNILRLTPDMFGLETFPCNTVDGASQPLPGVHYVLKTDKNISVDTAYSCFLYGQNASIPVNGVKTKSPRRVSSAALRDLEILRLERYILDPTNIFITYMPLDEFTWNHAVLSDWLLPETESSAPSAPSIIPRKLSTSWGALKTQ